LAHIRIDGNGLPGDAAMGGYFMILEIFLRPIMIIFALLGSITLFAAQVRVLHEIWQIVVSNVAGFDREAAASVATGLTGAIEWLRYPVDQLFYTLIYAVIVWWMCCRAKLCVGWGQAPTTSMTVRAKKPAICCATR
jgi:hypothetical protein